MTRRPKQIALTGLLMLLILAIVAVIANGSSSPSNPPAPSPPSTGSGPFLTASALPAGLSGRTVPDFRLTDARGGTITTHALRGRPYALTFLYVHCVNVCPLIGSEIHSALTDLGPRADKMNVVAISVDPRGDTRRAVLSWLKLHQEPANFHYLIGSQRRLAPVWKAFYVSPQIPGDPHSAHTAIIWLINGDGKLQALISAGLPINVKNLAHDFGVLIDRA